MQLLLQHGADYRIKDAQGRTALALAAESGSEDLAVRFLLNIPEINLPEAAAQGDMDAVRLLILGDPGEIFRRAAEGQPDNVSTAVAAAIQHRRFNILKLLLAGPPRSEGLQETVATQAFQASDYRLVMMTQGNLKETVATQFFEAARNGQTDLLADYISSGNNVTFAAKTWTGEPLFEAAGAGNLKLVRIMLAAGATVDAEADNWTALHSAAWSGRRDVVETLLNAGAKIDHAAPYGWRPIDDALWENHFDVVRYLEHAGRNSMPAWPPGWAARRTPNG